MQSKHSLTNTFNDHEACGLNSLTSLKNTLMLVYELKPLIPSYLSIFPLLSPSPIPSHSPFFFNC